VNDAPDTPLASEFFDRDPREVAPDLLGKVLISHVDGIGTGGRIVETEAYLGQDDAGSHAATRGVTPRNIVMYGPPGSVYVYFTYGCHHMLNLVCGPEGVAGAVLIRALEPSVGIEVMRERRSVSRDADLANGPGKLASAVGIDLSDNGSRLGEGRLAVYDAPPLSPCEQASSGRIGLSSGHELPYRYYVTESSCVSKSRPGHAKRGRRGTSRTQGR
jgi:DNA-3-methyladenine glycosylase